MSKIEVTKNLGNIEGLCLIEPKVFFDKRGYFVETLNQKDLKENGINFNVVQENQSFSQKGVLRGLHFQKEHPQGKIVRVVKGEVIDVAVDLRANSKTYGKFYFVKLTDENFLQFLIPEGFAHGFLVLSEEAIFCYSCSDFYEPTDECGIAFDDKDINIPWKVFGLDSNQFIISDKDKQWKGIKETNWKF